MLRKIHPTRLLLLLLLVATLLPLPSAQAAVSSGPVAAPSIPDSYWGMNLYASAPERTKGQPETLVDLALEAGVRWTREELSWASIEQSPGVYNWGSYESKIKLLNSHGFGIVGMLLTTPDWASGADRSDPAWYWYPPRDVKAYGAFVEAAVRRWKDYISVWELWNEPDKDGTWMPNANPEAYAALLAEGYAAVKRADPNARVVLGSVYVHDRNNEGLTFMDRVVAASGGALNFDIMGIHTFMLDRQPEDVLAVQPVQNLQYRIGVVRQWLDDHGGKGKPIWITEDGSSTCTNCDNLGTTPDLQAHRMVRQYMLAIAAGVSQFNYFQLRSKFVSGFGEPWASMELVDGNYNPKPAFYAYKTMTSIIGDGEFVGPGTLMQPQENHWQAAFTRYEYIFQRGQQKIHVLWTREDVGRETVQVPVTMSYVRAFKIDGQKWQPPVVDGKVELNLTSAPLYIVEEPLPADQSGLDQAVDPNSPTGLRVANRFLVYWQQYGGLPTFGYPISGERMETSADDSKPYVVQWFERARFESHPEHAGTPYEVLLGLLGKQVAAGREFATSPPFTSSASDRYFPETGHSLHGRFAEYWGSSGGLFLYGFPISEEIKEKSPIDGKEYTVQYFERARFELHPENAKPYDVLLGLLGRQLYQP